MVGGGTDTLTIYLHPSGCLDDGQTNPTGVEIYNWCETHNTVVDGTQVATNIDAFCNNEPLDKSFKKNDDLWQIYWVNEGDYCYFKVSADGHIECGIEG